MANLIDISASHIKSGGRRSVNKYEVVSGRFPLENQKPLCKPRIRPQLLPQFNLRSPYNGSSDDQSRTCTSEDGTVAEPSRRKST